MKKIVVLLSLLSVGLINAQAFKGKGDIKGQVGANFQSGATGITVSSDFGAGTNISFGLTATYLLNTDEIFNQKPSFDDRFDVKARFNANIGNVFKLDSKMDVYSGLDLGLRNFGAHLGVRYFFTEGFGVYAEGSTPLARYKTNLSDFDYLNNQFVFVLGTSFNL